MNRFLIKIAALCMLLISLNALAKEVVIATMEYPPFTTDQAKFGGFVNRVISEAFKREGIDVSFKYTPWKRALSEGEEGKVDGVSYSFENKKREKMFYFSEPLVENKEVLFHKKSTTVPKWKKIADLKNFTFGATRGYTYTEEFWKSKDASVIRVDVTANDLQNFKKLGAGRVDLFPMDEITGWNMLRAQMPEMVDSFTTSAIPLRSTTGHLIIGKKVTLGNELMQKFNSGLEKIKADGTYQKFEDELMQGIY